MTIPTGIAGRLALAFVLLAAVSQWLNHRVSSDLRRATVHQREVDKIDTISRVIEPQLKHEGERVRLVAQLIQTEKALSSSLQRKESERDEAIAGTLDLAYRQSGVDVLEITDAEGVVLYRAHAPAHNGDLATAWGVAEALAGSSALTSITTAAGPTILAVEPIWAGGQVIGTVSAGTLVGDRFIHAMSTEVGAELALIARTGDRVAASTREKRTPDISAVTAAFQQKIPIYHESEAMHTTRVYLPVLIVDDAWVIMAEIDSTSAFALLKAGDEKSTLITLLVLAGSIFITFIVLHYALKPLRQMHRRAEEIVVELTGEKTPQPKVDDIDAIVRVLNTLTDFLMDRNRELSLQQTNLQLEITRSQAAAAEINQLAFFDALTGLPNRRLLVDRLRQTMAASSRNGNYGAILFIDLDNFRTLNDTLGHAVGDLLLRQVAERLTHCVRDGDTVARFGSDEFVLVVSGLGVVEGDAAMGIETVADKVLTSINQTYQLGETTHHQTASIGVTLFKGHLTSIEDLMKQANLAMYKSQEAGRSTLHFFDPKMETAVMARAALEADLRQAVQENQFLLHYQPQVLETGGVTGAEALIRWQHPTHGMVSPADFIPLAEETGLILPLGHWVLEAACTQLASWSTQPAMAHLSLAVNVSACQLRQSDFVAQVLTVIRNSGANPQRLKLELTESLLVHNVQEIIEKMLALKAAGVGFSLDDFGTGYSSLSYLKQLPLDQLKIDRSFVRDVLIDPNDAAIAKTIVALAQSLGLGVIAEGVETEAQRDFLASSGCHAYQGYLFSRPLTASDFEKFAQQPHSLSENGS